MFKLRTQLSHEITKDKKKMLYQGGEIARGIGKIHNLGSENEVKQKQLNLKIFREFFQKYRDQTSSCLQNFVSFSSNMQDHHKKDTFIWSEMLKNVKALYLKPAGEMLNATKDCSQRAEHTDTNYDLMDF